MIEKFLTKGKPDFVPFKKENQIYFAKLMGEAVIPRKDDNNIGYDFYATLKEKFLIIPPFQTKFIPTGLIWSAYKNFYLKFYQTEFSNKNNLICTSLCVDGCDKSEIQIPFYNGNNRYVIISDYDEKLFEKEYPNIKNYIILSTCHPFAKGIVHKKEVFLTKEVSENIINYQI